MNQIMWDNIELNLCVDVIFEHFSISRIYSEKYMLAKTSCFTVYYYMYINRLTGQNASNHMCVSLHSPFYTTRPGLVPSTC